MSICEIFISHSSKDERIIEAFVDNILVGALNLKAESIFCTSLDGMKIKTGLQWRKAIKDNLMSAKIVFLIITSNYKSSEICLNEMGAAWISCKNVIPLIVDPIQFSQIGPLTDVIQAEKLNNDTSLDRIRDRVCEILSLDIAAMRTDRWTAQKQKLITTVRRHIENNPFPLAISRDTVECLERKNKELLKRINKLESALDSAKNECSQLQVQITDLEKLKDANAVKVLKKKNQVNSVKNQTETFNNLCNDIRSMLNKYPSVIRTLIYSSYTGNELDIDDLTYSSELKKAIANGIIDDEFEVNWASERNMEQLESALNHLNDFMRRDASAEFIEYLEENDPDMQFDIRKLNFWENVIHIQMN